MDSFQINAFYSLGYKVMEIVIISDLISLFAFYPLILDNFCAEELLQRSPGVWFKNPGDGLRILKHALLSIHQ